MVVVPESEVVLAPSLFGLIKFANIASISFVISVVWEEYLDFCSLGLVDIE